ncbi:DNA mismatch repair endonuclease MutL [Celerinatantimonas sp. MCCC 1A17872]|uniref:DNA mismatch repair endonuclease MutL n=1 Tax=Celerinatantimonas sp. MCCC 1A17872 TaxID=3177514 RepID=UPI0038CA1345
MAIHILPAQLANQIAAGEVVERPASVVKELVENSIDAGAQTIEVVIDRGGHKRILVRDDGCGVSEQELTLALSRHATSKLSSQDDLEHIHTLGFRGEALASISSVSRLTLTSRPKDQDKAWQAQAAGRDMNVNVTPAAHPVGTSVEVLDLFFNTPARRKFLRSEKTEFTHIDELLKRLALSHYDITIKVTHNDKLLRQYRAAQTPEQYARRVAAVMGKRFIEQSWAIDNQHQNLRLWGWVGTPQAACPSNELQYFYVNGRVIRDKLILHAIRQSFANVIDDKLYPSFVLYLELPTEQVDVNVHPTKHEVRFHQARLIHDYIQKVLNEVIQPHLDEEYTQDVSAHYHDYAVAEPSVETKEAKSSPQSSTSYQPTPLRYKHSDGPSQRQLTTQRQWLADSAKSEPSQSAAISSSGASLRPLQLLGQSHLLVGDQTSQLALLDLAKTWQQVYTQQFIKQWPKIVAAPLLLPQKIVLDEEAADWAGAHLELLAQLGISMRDDKTHLTLLAIPSSLRRAAQQPFIERLVAVLMQHVSALEDTSWLCQQLAIAGSSELQFNWSSALGVYQQSLELTDGVLSEQLLTFVDDSLILKALHND